MDTPRRAWLIYALGVASYIVAVFQRAARGLTLDPFHRAVLRNWRQRALRGARDAG